MSTENKTKEEIQKNKKSKDKIEEDKELEAVEVESTGGGIGAGGGYTSPFIFSKDSYKLLIIQSILSIDFLIRPILTQSLF